MDKLSMPIQFLLKEKNEYLYDIHLYCDTLSFLPFLENAIETDYIIYHEDQTFEYTPHFYSFINTLLDSKIIEDANSMEDFLEMYNSKNAYRLWIKDMNTILNNDDYMLMTNLSFIRKALYSMIKLENIIEGSWGIDVETGNWCKILKRLKTILPEVYRCQKENMH